MSIPDSPTDLTNFDSKIDDPAVFILQITGWFSNHALVFQGVYTTNCITSKLCLQKLLVVIFPSYFFIFFTEWQYTTTISSTLVIINILISF